MKFLLVGDVFARPGRKKVSEVLPDICKSEQIDFIIVNAENCAHGRGPRPKDIEFFRDLGVDVITLGDHTYDQNSLEKSLDEEKYLIRPANYVDSLPGKGYIVKDGVLVINLLGRTFTREGLLCPFETVDKILNNYELSDLKAIIVDMHAEATSEKYAMKYFLDGRVSAVIGTHTHVQTADESISTEGTAYISDVGMTGVYDSVIGMDKEIILEKFLRGVSRPFKPAIGEANFAAVVFEVKNQKASMIKRVFI